MEGDKWGLKNAPRNGQDSKAIGVYVSESLPR